MGFVPVFRGRCTPQRFPLSLRPARLWAKPVGGAAAEAVEGRSGSQRRALRAGMRAAGQRAEVALLSFNAVLLKAPSPL